MCTEEVSFGLESEFYGIEIGAGRWGADWRAEF